MANIHSLYLLKCKYINLNLSQKYSIQTFSCHINLAFPLTVQNLIPRLHLSFNWGPNQYNRMGSSTFIFVLDAFAVIQLDSHVGRTNMRCHKGAGGGWRMDIQGGSFFNVYYQDTRSLSEVIRTWLSSGNQIHTDTTARKAVTRHYQEERHMN